MSECPAGLTRSLSYRSRSVYTILHTQYPQVWDTVKFGCLFTGAELTQQVMIKKVWDADFNVRPWGAERDPMDWDSIFRYSVWGFCVFPHVLRKWYRFLDGRLDGNSWKVVVQKTVIDQAIFPGKNL